MGDVTFPADVIKRYNQFFLNVKESDHDRYGLLTPGDILAGEGGEEQKAVSISDYFTHAQIVNLDDNPATQDSFVYRDASTATLSIKVGGSLRPIFSLNFANPDDCFITYPEDHYNLPISPRQCRLIRAAHPLIEGLSYQHLKPETWIREGDERVLISANDIQSANKDLIRLAGAAKVGAQLDTPQVMWDIFALPLPLTLNKIHGSKIEMPRYPLIRDNGDTPIRAFSGAEMEELFASTGISGKIGTSPDNKNFYLIFDDSEGTHFITPRYGWIVNRTDMRGLPTDKQFLLYAADDDHLQWTALNSEQPVAIIGEATDKDGVKWYHVLAYKAWGWVKAKDVALLSKEKAIKIWTNPNILTVISPNTVINGHFLEMGTRLQVLSESKDSYTVAISRRLADGGYGKERVVIKKSDISEDVGQRNFYKGRVPFSRMNMVKLLFRYLGTPWAMANERRGDDIVFPHQGGNRKLYIDCSGIIEKAMDAMGLYAFSRTSKWQTRQGRVLWEKKDGALAVEKAFEQFGKDIWLIGMPGHVMFFLGEQDGVHWMLHSPGHFRKYDSNSDDFVRNGDGQVVVSPVTLSNLNRKFNVLMMPAVQK